MDVLWNELAAGMPDAQHAVRVIVRVFIATLLGAVVGYERERTGKSAGLRTHMLVSLGSAMFVIAPLEAGMLQSDLSRIIQGVATGIGFLGAGAILKVTSEREIQGLTTAAGIWLTAGVGLAVGMGRYGLAAMTVGLAWVILDVIARLDARGR
jgi:putative Mg2+ transporter-C (MgtC) family protein